MRDYSAYVGLDVHKDTIAVAVVTYRNKQSSMFCPGSCET